MHRWLHTWIALVSLSFLARSAWAEAPPKEGESPGKFAAEISFIAGGGFYLAGESYEDTDSFGQNSTDLEYEGGPGFTGEIDAALGYRGKNLALGGSLRIGTMRSPSAFTGEAEQRSAAMLGPKLQLFQGPDGGGYANVAAGVALLGSQVGFGATASAGYQKHWRGPWWAALEGSLRWTRSIEEGDNGTYPYRDYSLGANLVLTAR
jgi:hypothetical protein